MSGFFKNTLSKISFSKIFHFLLRIILPISILILIRLNFIQLALLLIVLSKWRMFAVKPRFWLANILANSVDIIVGISLAYFIYYSSPDIYWQIVWTIAYIIWLLLIKPAESIFFVSIQSFIGQFVGLTALYMFWPNGSIWGLSLLVGLIAYVSARHFLNSFDEIYANLIAFFWFYTAASLAWLTSHWLIYYKVFSQPTMLLSIIGYGLAIVYYLDHFKKYKKFRKWEVVGVFLISLIIIIFYSSWTYRVV